MTVFDLLDLPLTRYLDHFRCYYPGILEWYSSLQEDLLNGRRSVFLSRKGTEVQGLAITKNGSHAKLCHISVLPTARGRGLGRTLMSLALKDMERRGATEIHVTTGEEVFGEHADYFRGFGFSLYDWRLNRYRKGTSELIWTKTVKFDPNWGNTTSKEPNNIGQFYCQANPFSPRVSRFNELRNAIEHWYPSYVPKTQDESLSDNLWSASNDRGSDLRLLPSCSQPARSVANWKPSTESVGTYASTLLELLRRTNSCSTASLIQVAQAEANEPWLDCDGKAHLWDCQGIRRFEEKRQMASYFLHRPWALKRS
jgi:ribosomal protein S18 acetylase RimI-like enzyme